MKSHYRWVICGLLFFAAVINYIDRQVIGILKPTLQEEFQFSERDYASIVFSFQFAYAVGLLLSGRLIDRIGVRWGFALAVIFWSLGAMAHSMADWFPQLQLPTLSISPVSIVLLSGATAGFALARLILGLGEAGNFPASIKAVAEWFPRKERAFATGLFNSGTNIGALATPMIVPWLAQEWGWEWAFIITGLFGFGWVLFWLGCYRSPSLHRRVSAGELAHIQSDQDEPIEAIAWSRLLPHRQTWAFAVGKWMTDPIWWLYLFWIPDFLHANHGLDLKTMGPPLVAIYLIADIGSIGGGWLSSYLIQRGWSTNRARKGAMLCCALSVVPIYYAAQTDDLWTAVGLISLAAAAHQGWSANLFTLTSDLFPKQAIGSVVGIGGMAGAIGGMLIAIIVGEILQRTQGNYRPIFLIASSAYLLALLIIHLLSPKLTPAKLSR